MKEKIFFLNDKLIRENTEENRCSHFPLPIEKKDFLCHSIHVSLSPPSQVADVLLSFGNSS